MAANHTEHFNLSQWAADDGIVRADFNADNAALDAALHELDETRLRCASGSYTGAGEYGEEHPNTLSFPFTPKLVVIANGQNKRFTALLVRGLPFGAAVSFGSSDLLRATQNVTWSEDGISWYVTAAATPNGTIAMNAEQQLNASGSTYSYFAIG